MQLTEKNIATFSTDVTQKGRYVYTDQERVSAKIANHRQSQEIIEFILEEVGEGKRILDIGCGDGTYSFELLQAVKPSLILGFDPAKAAIDAAKKRISTKNITFVVLNIYDIDRVIKKNQFDIAVIRGVLHHLYDAPLAISKISKVVPVLVVLEPNGYNPILKGIEKLSSYHVEHEEKSYWPPTLNSWFEKAGYKITKQKFVGIVPYFCPTWLAYTLKKVEPFFEKLPFIRRFYAGTNVLVAKK